MGFSLEQYFIELMETLNNKGLSDAAKLAQVKADACFAMRYASECGQLPRHYAEAALTQGREG